MMSVINNRFLLVWNGPSWSWSGLSRRRRLSSRQQRILVQGLLLFLNVIFLPLSQAGGSPSPSSSSSELIMTSTESSRVEQRVTISMSYSSTNNIKAGPTLSPSLGNSSSSSNSSNSSSNSSSSSHNQHRRHSTSVSSYSNHNSNHRHINLSNHVRRGLLRTHPRKIFFVPNPSNPIKSSPSLVLSSSNRNASSTGGGGDSSAPEKPLRIFHAGMSKPTAATSFPVKSQYGGGKPKQIPHLIFVPSSKENLNNHRITGGSERKVIIPAKSNNSNKAQVPSSSSSLTSDLQAQLELINQRTAVPPSISSREASQSDDRSRPLSTRNSSTASPLIIPIAGSNNNNGGNKKESRSDLISEDSPPGPKGRSGSVVEGRSVGEKKVVTHIKTAGGSSGKKPLRAESKQMNGGPFSYLNTLTDQIAEEDHQYEVTEMVNQYPAEYENQEQSTDAPASASSTSTAQQQEQQDDEAAPSYSSMEFPSQIQNPNHNYHNGKPNLKAEKTRPKLNSYYDQNYHHPPHHNHQHHPFDSVPQSSKNEFHFDYNQRPENNNNNNKPPKQQDFHYYANGNNINNNDHGNFHDNDEKHTASHYVKPGFGTFWPSPPPQLYPHPHPHHPHHRHPLRPDDGGRGGGGPPPPPYPPPPPGHEKYPSHPPHFNSNSSPPKSSSSNNNNNNHHHPPPQPYKGEHDQQTAAADNIMDRFEVFYKEYKLLTWAAFFIITSLGFLAILVYMYIRNPPTEVVTARSKITEYLTDPGLMKFLSNLLDSDPRSSSDGALRRRRRRKQSETKEL